MKWFEFKFHGVSLHAVWVFKINFCWKHFIILNFFLVVAVVRLEPLVHK